MSKIYGEVAGGFGFAKTYILTDEDGNEFTGVYVDKETIFDATDNDVRKGSVYAGNEGKSTGTKIIPVYYASCGKKISEENSIAVITIPEYNYDDLIITISTYDTSITESVVSTYVSIDNVMYTAGNGTKVSDILVDEENEQINLGVLLNEKSVIRYFVIKEEY